MLRRRKLSKVQVLLSSYNGEKYIDQQLKSIIAQQGVDVSVLIRDDGSVDSTREILGCYSDNEKTEVLFENNIGVINSFLTLIDKSRDSDYYAFSDQDDYWDDNKLQVATEALINYVDVPAMYFSATRIVDENLKVIPNAPQASNQQFAFNLRQILHTNNATGCTIVFNKKLRDLLVNNHPNRAIMHDHWVYLVCLALGGKVVFDEIPHISYRQHGGNVLGNKKSIKALLKYSSFTKNKNIRSDLARDVLVTWRNEISDSNFKILEKYAYYRQGIRRILFAVSELYYFDGIKRKIGFLAEALLGFY